MLQYNIWFELTALIMLGIVFANAKVKKSIRNSRNKFFILFIWVGIFDIICDLVSTIFISYPDIYPYMLQEVSLQLLYAMQLTLPYMLYLYVVFLRAPSIKLNKPFFISATIPYGIMMLLVLINPWLHLFFYFDEGNQYIRGPIYLAMYLFGLVYLVACLIDTIIFRKRIGPENVKVVWEFVFVAGIAVAIQMFFNDVLLTGLGIAAALIILLMTIQNPNESIDNLTGAYGAKGFSEKLKIVKKSDTKIWVILVSLDNLSRINHIFGMEAGDQILKDVASYLQKYAGEDNVFRFLGDRFAVTLYSAKDYGQIKGLLREYYDMPHIINGTKYKLSACICSLPELEIDSSVDHFLSFVDYFISETKKNGAGSEKEVDQNILDEYKRHRDIEEYLNVAIENKYFNTYFQPIYSCKEDKFVSVECLARLSHPELGNISPAEFIPIAERSGQIASVDYVLFNKTCEFIKENPNLFTEKIRNVKFNISPVELIREDYGERILEIIEHYKINPSIFQFEITETAATLYGREIEKWVEIMREAGCGICLDDFGSGYANLDSIINIPFDVVKLDRSMLEAAMVNEGGERIYTRVFEMMSKLGFNVVAEGAETKEQIEYLKGISVDFIQGYYYSRPLSQSQLIEFFESKKVTEGVNE